MEKFWYGTLEGIYEVDANGFPHVIIKSSGSIEQINDMTNVMSKSKAEGKDILINNFNSYLFALTRKGWKVKSIQMDLADHKIYLLELLIEED